MREGEISGIETRESQTSEAANMRCGIEIEF